MLDQAKSSANPRRTPTQGTLAPSPALADAPPSPLPEGLSRPLKADEPLYSIRVADNPGTVCAACRQQETGTGPVGYRDDSPICDLCLLEGNHELGMVLAVVAVTRAYASVKNATLDERQEALRELGAFARVYEAVAAKSWPARVFKIVPDFTKRDDTTN